MTPTLTLPTSLSLSLSFSFSFFFFFVVFGGPPQTREEAGLRFTCSIRLKKGFEEAFAKKEDREGGGGLGSDKDGGRYNEQS